MATALQAAGQGRVFKGRVIDKKTGEPVEFATVLIKSTEQWSVTDQNGRFSIGGITAAESQVEIASLGYVTLTQTVKFPPGAEETTFRLSEDNLTLESAVVTAQENGNSATTSRTIDKTALEHVQVMNVTDISSLLPGGVTENNNLITQKQFSIRTGSSGENGNASFGTAVEVDGVRLSNNASYSDLSSGSNLKGVSTNSIASSNVESVEVISGVPSVEYGDMSSGVVKINTKKGKTPWQVTLSTSPKTKQASFSKGFGLGKTAGGRAIGILNASAEYTRSVGDQMSPYTSYDRKQLSLTYSNSFGSARPLRFSAGITGNLGGLDNRADPDRLIGTFTIARDNAVRGNVSANWLLSLPWITNLEVNASAAYSDKLSRDNQNYQQSVSGISLHALSTGYYMSAPYVADSDNPVVMIPPGNWYNVMAVDDRPLTSKISVKANQATHFGKANNKVKVGAEWSWDTNLGVGRYSEDQASAPTYREYRYCDNPAMHNIGAFAEDNIMIPIGAGHLNLIAGIRWDNTYIKGSAYGLTSSLSPRFNAKYTVVEGASDRFLRDLSFRGSWGVAVKQPSFSILYPTPTYLDVNVFTSTASADNTVYRAYYVHPRTIEYNADLVWQRNKLAEVGMEANLAGVRISLAAYVNSTLDAYRLDTEYERFTYNYTSTAAVQGLPIPAENRVYLIDPSTGVVTVKDKTGALPEQSIAPKERKQFISKTFESNANYPITRRGLEWVVDFPKIKAIGTAIRVDGSLYSYRYFNTNMEAYCPSTISGADSEPFRYIGYFVGGQNVSNGSESRTLRNNVTITTHIPRLRMILSLKVESSLLRYSRSLSWREDGTRTFVLNDKSNLLDFDTSASIYDGDGYAVVFPDYYVSYDNPGAQVPFLEKFRWAKENDAALYSDLAKLVGTSNYVYTFGKDYISPYFSANVSVTKELGDLASISFYANNFLNNMGQVLSSKTGTYSSVTSYIPTFYYGLTLRLKF
ncbi:MAG: TonB-dependent receptor [Bacteroidales bacterium]|nr:TonB-dependent receptor [Bacteroidales bacterium]